MSEVKTELALIAAGFLGNETSVASSFGVELNERTNIKTLPGKYSTNVAKYLQQGICTGTVTGGLGNS